MLVSKRSNQPSMADKYSPFIDSDKKEEGLHVFERSYVMSKQYQNLRAKSICSKINLEETERNRKYLKEQINAVKLGHASALSHASNKDSLQKIFNSPSNNKENIPFPIPVKPSIKLNPIKKSTTRENSSNSKNDFFSSLLDDIDKNKNEKPQTAQPKVCHSNIFTQPLANPPPTVEPKIKDIEVTLSLNERCKHPNWQIRKNAYKEIGTLFATPNSIADSLESSQQKDPFALYAHMLGTFVTDTNITAQFEAYCTVLECVNHMPTVMSPVYTLVPLLLDKAWMSKSHFKDITVKILTSLIKRGCSEYVMNELYSRISRKQVKLAIYCLVVISELVITDCIEKINFQKLYKVVETVIVTYGKEVREVSISILRVIYSHVEDTVEVFVSNMKQIKPNVVKEIEKSLTGTQKSKTILKRLFIEKIATENKKLIDTDCEDSMVDLNECMDEEMKKISYVTKADHKRKILAGLKVKLEKVTNDNSHIAKKDYSLLLNLLTNLIDDNDSIIQIESIQIIIILAQCLKAQMDRQKARLIIYKIIEKYKETKTTIVELVNQALTMMATNECISEAELFDCLTAKSQAHKNPKVRYSCLLFIQGKLTEQMENSNPNLRKTFEESIDLIFKKGTHMMFLVGFLSQHQKLISKNFIAILSNEQKSNIKIVAISILASISSVMKKEDIYLAVLNKMPIPKQKEISVKYASIVDIEAVSSKSKETQEKSRVESEAKGELSPPIEKPKMASVLELRKSLTDRIASFCDSDNMSIVITISKMMISNSNVVEYVKAIDSEKLNKARKNIIQSLPVVMSSCTCYQEVPKLIMYLYKENKYSPLEEDENELHYLLLVIFALFALLDCNTFKREVFYILTCASSSISFKCMVLGLHSILFKVKYKEIVLANGNRMNCFVFVFEWIAEQLGNTNVAYSKASIENLLSILNGESYDEKYKKIFIEIQERILKLLDVPRVVQIKDSLSSTIIEKWKVSDVRKVLQNKNILQIRRTLNSFVATLREEKENAASAIFGEDNPATQLDGIIADLVKLYKTAKLKAKEISNVCGCLIDVIPEYSEIILEKILLECYSLLTIHQSNEQLEIYEVLNDCSKTIPKNSICKTVVKISNLSKVPITSLFVWLDSQIIGNYFELDDVSELCSLIAKGLSEQENTPFVTFLEKMVNLIGQSEIKDLFEKKLSNSSKYYLSFIEWYESKYEVNDAPKTEGLNNDEAIEELNPNTSNVPQLILSPVEPPQNGEQSDSKVEIESQVKKLNDIYQKEVKECINLKQKIDSKSSQRKSIHLRPTPSPKKAEEITAFSPRFGSEELVKKSDPPLNIKELSTEKKDVNLTLQKIVLEPVPQDVLEESKGANLDKFRYMFIQPSNSYQDIALQMIEYYKGMSQLQREDMVEGIANSLESEPYLKSISCEAYLNIMRLCFSVCMIEKSSHNEITNVAQRMQICLNNLLNYRSYSFILKCLIRLMKQVIPQAKMEITEEQRTLMSYVSRCISKINEMMKGKAIKTWVILFELNELFLMHPPEKLREDIPYLEDYDAAFRILKEVSDECLKRGSVADLIGVLQQNKDYNENAFTKYLRDCK